MKPIEFKEKNLVYGENQKEYIPLPAFRNPDDPNGEVVCCHSLSWSERIRVMITGRIYSSIWMFANPSVQPQFHTTNKFDIFNRPSLNWPMRFRAWMLNRWHLEPIPQWVQRFARWIESTF